MIHRRHQAPKEPRRIVNDASAGHVRTEDERRLHRHSDVSSRPVPGRWLLSDESPDDEAEQEER